MKLATKLTWMMLIILLLVGSSIGYFGYRTAYHQVDEAAGIELVGCANITTGLIDPADISALVSGDNSKLAAIEDRIGWIVAHKPIFKEAFIISLDGKILAADANFKQRGYQAGDSFYFTDEDKEMITTMKHSAYSKVYTYEGTSLKTGYGPIYQDHDPTKPIVALMAINFDGSLIQERTLDIIVQPFIIGGSIFMVAILVVYLLIRHMVSPLTKLSASVNTITKGDLTHEPLLFKNKDEIGTLARDFNDMTMNLRNLITQVNDTSMLVASSSQELSASAQATNRAGEHSVNVTIELADGAHTQLQNLEGSYKAIQDMSRFISDIAGNADIAMNKAADNVQKARLGRESMDSTTSQMGVVSESIGDLSSIIHTLGSHSKEIENIVGTIASIAEETNLLSLNAAIEAARAGEEGQGFAVVAGSVRKLAERSANSATQISELISLIIAQMDKAGETMKRSTNEMMQGKELIISAGRSFSEIEVSISDMSSQSEQISATVRDLALISEELVEAIQNTVMVSNHTVKGAESLSASSEQQLAAMQEVESSAALLSSLAEKLQVLVENFKI
ncbi:MULTISPECIES: methyl-accepting chemotaxis protein [Paenibacillus]|jgi:methyl-accepting chemotaxis protein|uniref:Methyl-accepting chemotaxis protein n=2 Tax=Paenibacillus TaxID=44249 RepID=A0AAP3ZVA2_PAEPO|nr:MULTISPECIES: methyl-accepting chemotaxis protein [Paenibacillus]AHC19309.1 chemotaxis protein [Paenibacillus polymyxa CR1]APB76717.1 methyl-accepting chemotaxis protein [Paenibacillus polymyxa]APQ58783.1 chemotaxis protein [Paenibacillus polymyxa]MDH2329821.1 methyl-accepting chemotaxis protein [Paenibacillus polymyxa]MDR6778023.1 methyl-accepting chemotaxis protein [Paenibacillus peoriae]